jgi:hypothetical protein
MCDSCDSSAFLSCSTFGVCFYVIIGALVLVAVVIHTLIILKMRRNREAREMDFSGPLTGD